MPGENHPSRTMELVELGTPRIKEHIVLKSGTISRYHTPFAYCKKGNRAHLEIYYKPFDMDEGLIKDNEPVVVEYNHFEDFGFMADCIRIPVKTFLPSYLKVANDECKGLEFIGLKDLKLENIAMTEECYETLKTWYMTDWANREDGITKPGAKTAETDEKKETGTIKLEGKMTGMLRRLYIEKKTVDPGFGGKMKELEKELQRMLRYRTNLFPKLHEITTRSMSIHETLDI